jgi:hypothetical protein
MGYRKFVDRDGNEWEVRDLSKTGWELVPIASNRQPARSVPVPTYEADPFELSEQELQKLLDGGGDARSHLKKSPFKE